MGLAKAVLGSFPILTINGLLSQATDQICVGLVQATGNPMESICTSVKIGNRHHVPYPEYRRLWEETMTRVLDASIDDIEAELFADE